jgi:hypothetical protein
VIEKIVDSSARRVARDILVLCFVGAVERVVASERRRGSASKSGAPRLRMPPPHLQNLSSSTASARVPPGQLTPRTPHSRAGRAEEAFTELEMDQFGDSDSREYTLQQQSEPLLASSSSANFPPSGYRARGDDDRDTVTKGPNYRNISRWLVANSGLILGSGFAVVLFLLIILSYKRPDVLLSAIGAENTASPIATAPKQDDAHSSDIEHIISYENYTHFPLDPMEYLAECHKLMGEVIGPTKYWSGQKDVIHHEVNPGKYPVAEGLPTQICSKTITYMLDGHVGLLADLALMAQAAGLAREVTCPRVQPCE